MLYFDGSVLPLILVRVPQQRCVATKVFILLSDFSHCGVDHSSIGI